MKVTIVIPNWNGKELLEKNLPKVLYAAPDAEIIVVDDASPDDSNNLLEKKFSSVKIIKHSANQGFASSCNDGVARASGEAVVLLNLDVIPQNNFLDKALPHFSDPNVFAVSFNEPNYSWSKIYWENGFIEHGLGEKTDKAHISGWASGGSAVFKKSIWLLLGGFDMLYKPFYWEDLDLGYRAWKKGYKILWEPESIVHHEHEAIIGKHFTKEFIDYISARNQLLFIWKNVHNPKMLLEHKIYLLKRLCKPGYWKPFLGALIKIPEILVNTNRFGNKLTDNQVFEMFK